MKKSYFLKFFLFAMIGTLVTMTSCEDYDDDIDDLQEQINTLKTTVDAINSDIQAGSVITSVTSTTGGITVNLSNGESYDITNGANGAAGADGAPGSVVTIGENGNWFIDGVDTELSAQGPQGEPGADGAYYVPNEDGFWHKVEGETDEATTQSWLPGGTITAVFDPVTGVVSLYNVEGSDVPIVLGKGTLAGLLFAPDTMEDGLGVVDLGYIDGVLDEATVKSTFQTNLKLNFRFNPSVADISETTWKYIGNSMKFRDVEVLRSSPASDDPDIFTVSSFTDKIGWGEFGLQVVDWAEPAAGEERVLALQGISSEGEKTNVVTSDYVKIDPVEYYASIADAKSEEHPDYRTESPSISADNDHEDLLYTAEDVDLLDYVWAAATPAAGGEKERFEDYGFTDYKFEFSKEVNYAGLDGVTNQNAFVSLDGSKLTVLQGTAAIDRTPLIEVTLKSTLNEAVLAVGYIKFKIVESAPIPATPRTYTFDGGTIPYADLFKGETEIDDNKTDIVVDWTEMNGIYTDLGLSHNRFQSIYGALTPTEAVEPEDHNIGDLVKSTEAPDVDTYALKYQITPRAQFGPTTVTYTLTPDNEAYPVLNFVFTYNIVKPTLDKTILDGYRYNDSPTDILTQGMNTGEGYLMQLYLGEAFAFGTAAYRNVFAEATADKIGGASHTFQFKEIPVQTGASLTPNDGETINGTLGTSDAPTSGQLMILTTKLTTAERVYDMQFVTEYPNGEDDVFDFKVHFVNPFEIILADDADFQLIDKLNGTADTEDVMDNYIVTFKGKNIVTKGIAETADGANTVKATDYVDIADPNYGLFYTLNPGTEYFTISKAGGNDENKESVLTWDNAGTQLTSEQKVATLNVKFAAEFAEITRDPADDITVKPE